MKLRYTTIYYYENSFQYGFLFPPYLLVLFAHIGTSIHHHKSYFTFPLESFNMVVRVIIFFIRVSLTSLAFCV